MNKDEAETFLTELASEFLKRRDSDLALKVRIARGGLVLDLHV